MYYILLLLLLVTTHAFGTNGGDEESPRRVDIHGLDKFFDGMSPYDSCYIICTNSSISSTSIIRSRLIIIVTRDLFRGYHFPCFRDSSTIQNDIGWLTIIYGFNLIKGTNDLIDIGHIHFNK